MLEVTLMHFYKKNNLERNLLVGIVTSMCLNKLFSLIFMFIRVSRRIVSETGVHPLQMRRNSLYAQGKLNDSAMFMNDIMIQQKYVGALLHQCLWSPTLFRLHFVRTVKFLYNYFPHLGWMTWGLQIISSSSQATSMALRVNGIALLNTLGEI